MKINVCINGTFRYPTYVRHYASTGALGRFYFAHRRGDLGASLGLTPDAAAICGARNTRCTPPPVRCRHAGPSGPRRRSATPGSAA